METIEKGLLIGYKNLEQNVNITNEYTKIIIYLKTFQIK